jgi:hypothetical protein
MHVQLLLTQHFLAVPATSMLRCSLNHGNGHSTLQISADSIPALSRIVHEFTGNGHPPAQTQDSVDEVL